jgi:hypothetical protein
MHASTLMKLNTEIGDFFCELDGDNSWYLDYEDSRIPVTMHEHRMALISANDTIRKNGQNGHDLLSALANDGATIRDIATVMHSSYLDVAWLLTFRPPEVKLFGIWQQPSLWRELRLAAKSSMRLLRVIAADVTRQIKL